MTPNDVVEAMARRIHDAHPGVHEPWAQIVAAEALGNRLAERTVALRRAEARAAIRAVHERGGLVVARMPENATHGPALNQLMGDASAWVGGYNAALAAVRANAVEAEG